MSVHGQVSARRKCCADCGCRRGSPLTPFADVADMAAMGEPFYCHQGVMLDEHGGFEWDLGPGAAPPLKADGSPADLCAGWAAYRRVALRL